MAFHVYPEPPSPPLTVPPNTESPAFAIEQLTAMVGGNKTMFLGVAISDPASAPLVRAPAPAISLQVDEGDPVALIGDTQAIYRQPGTNPADYVADAMIELDPTFPNVFLITVVFFRVDGNYAWQIRIRNNELAAKRTFTWVVAGSEAETRQPWLALPAGLDFNQPQPFIPVGGEALAQVQVCNRGAGPLALERIDLTPGAGFAVAAPWPPRLAPSQGAALAFRLTPVAPGVHQATCTVASDDPLANAEQPTPAHNNRITLQATVAGITELDFADGHQGDERRPATIAGYSLAQTQAVVFSGSGVTAHLDQTRPLTDTQVPIVLTIAPDATLGSRTFTLKTAEGDLASGSVPFTVYERAITALSLDKGQQGDKVPLVVISGQGLAGATQVDFIFPDGSVDGKITAAVDTQHVTDNQVPVTITITQDADLGERTLRIAGPTWHIAGGKPFTIIARPVIIALDPNRYLHGEICPITIIGYNLGYVNRLIFAPTTGIVVLDTDISTREGGEPPLDTVKFTLDLTEANVGVYPFQIATPYGSNVDSGTVRFAVTEATRVDQIYPAGHRPPGTVPTRIAGQELDGVEAIIFPAESRITASAISAQRDELTCNLQIPMDAQPGKYRFTLKLPPDREATSDAVTFEALTPLSSWEEPSTAGILAYGGPDLTAFERLTPALKLIAFRYGQLVATSRDGTVYCWDTITEHGHPPCIFRQHTDTVVAADLHQWGGIAVTASRDRTARLWSTLTGEEIAVLRGHTDELCSAMYSPDYTRIVTASLDRTARLWDGETGNAVCCLTGHTQGVLAAIFSPDGSKVATASRDGTARLWNANDGKLLLILKHEGKVLSVAFSPDGAKLVTTSDDKSARLWNSATGEQLYILTGHQNWVTSAAFSPSGKWLVTTSTDHSVLLWEVATGTKKRELRPQLGYVYSVAFNPEDDRTFLTTHQKNVACLWDVYQEGEPIRLMGHDERVLTGVYDDFHSTYFATASADNTVRIWSCSPKRPMVYHVEPTFWFQGQTIDVDIVGPHLATITEVTIDRASGISIDPAFVRSHDPATGLDCIRARFTIAPDAKANQSYPLLLKRTFGQEINSDNVKFEVRAAWRITPNQAEPENKIYYATITGQNLANAAHVTFVDADIKADILSKGAKIDEYPADVEPMAFLSPFLGQYRPLILTDKRQDLWDLATHKKLHHFEKPGTAAAFSPDGKLLALSDDDGFCFWDLERNVKAAQCPEYRNATNLAFSVDGKTLLTVDVDRAAVWQVVDNQPEKLDEFTSSVQQPITVTALAPTGDSVFVVVDESSLGPGPHIPSSRLNAYMWEVRGKKKPFDLSKATLSITFARFVNKDTIITIGTLQDNIITPDNSNINQMIDLWDLAHPGFAKPLGFPRLGVGQFGSATYCVSDDGRYLLGVQQTLKGTATPTPTLEPMLEMKVWDIEHQNEPLSKQLPGARYTSSEFNRHNLAVSSKGNVIATYRLALDFGLEACELWDLKKDEALTLTNSRVLSVDIVNAADLILVTDTQALSVFLGAEKTDTYLPVQVTIGSVKPGAYTFHVQDAQGNRLASGQLEVVQ